jgi:cell wall-associated NlpC family hydrolase
MRKLVWLLPAALMSVGCASIKPAVQPASQVNTKKAAAKPVEAQFLSDIAVTHEPTRTVQSSKTSFTPKIKVAAVPEPEITRTRPDNNLLNSNIENFKSLQFKYAIMMDVTVERLSNANMYAFIEDWYGTRYRYGGTGRSGIDCSSFTQTLTSNVFGITLERTARAQYGSTRRIEREELREGDLVFFNTRGGVSHVGVYLQNGHFVHASSSKGVMISSLNDGYYASRYIGGGRPLVE